MIKKEALQQMEIREQQIDFIYLYSYQSLEEINYDYIVRPLIIRKVRSPLIARFQVANDKVIEIGQESTI